jgi:2,3-diketo-5-methylthio-1-phosphopentane phosphatase
MLLVLDFDGTITERDVLDTVVRRFAPRAWEEAEQALVRGTMTLNEVIAYEFERVTAGADEVLAYVRETAVLRPGLPELIAFCRERFIDAVIVSSGFHELIEPVLRDHGVAMPVVAHRATFDRAGASVRFLERPVCESCGETCKRVDLPRLSGGRVVAYVGDGWSDRCAAEAADVRFARAGLAQYLDGRNVPYTPFETLTDVRDGLARYLRAA